MHALVKNNEVIQVSDEQFDVHPVFAWVDIGTNPNNVAVGHGHYDGHGFVAPRTLYAKDTNTHTDLTDSIAHPVPDTHTATVREAHQVWDDTTSGFIHDATGYVSALAAAVAGKNAAVDAETKERTELGFNSNALGTQHHYDARKDFEQINLPRTIAVARVHYDAWVAGGSNGAEPTANYMAMPTGQHFVEVPHTLAQLNTVLLAMDTFVEGQRAIARHLKGRVATAAEVTDPENRLAALEAVEDIDPPNEWSTQS